MAMGILLSEQFTNVFKPLVDALEGREQPLLYLPSNFLVFMIESTFLRIFPHHPVDPWIGHTPTIVAHSGGVLHRR